MGGIVMDLKALHKVSYGIYIVGSKKGKKFNGQIANTVVQVSAEPPTVAVSVNKQNLTHGYILESKVFTVSILSKETPLKFIGRFGFNSGRTFDKFKGVRYRTGVTGAPAVTENALAYLEAEITGSLDAGTHTVFVGRVVGAEVLKEGEPLTYAYYREVKRGATPKTAPIYIGEEGKKERYRCTVCGYIYDPEKGDPESGIKPGTPFEELPDGWVCPVCGADKSKFEKEADR